MPPTFAQLGVPAPIVGALERRGIAEPFEIQAATIEDALAGRDVLGRAPTGSGKTLAFGIPLVARVERAKPKRPRALVLSPTRELADQITKELKTFAGDVRVAAVYGGVGYGPQVNALRRGVEVLVACPGRLEDLIERGDVQLGQVDIVVLDEADRMADMGFLPAVRRLLDQAQPKRQTVLFSATLDGDVAKLTRDYQHEPVRHEVGEATPDITVADHVFWNVTQANRVSVASEAVNAVWPAIVFCRTRHGADRLTRQLAKNDIKAAAIHGGRSQNQRTRALANFAEGRVHALVATDVAARGIHVDGVASVIHYDPPEDHKTYVHRSGRTARAGEGGVVVSLLKQEQIKDARKVQKKVGLDEPVTDPDAVALRALSDSPTRELAPQRPEDADPEKRQRNSGRRGPNQRSGARRGSGGGKGGGKSKGGGKGKGGSSRRGGGGGGGRNASSKAGSGPKSSGNKNRSGSGSGRGSGAGGPKRGGSGGPKRSGGSGAKGSGGGRGRPRSAGRS
jgi:superfamily II DNA/RNA helicase